MPEPTYQSPRSLSPSADNDIEPSNNDPNGPIAEALIQSDQSFHSLKILKPAPSEMQNEQHKTKEDADQMSYRQPRRGVFSQVSDNRIRVFSTHEGGKRAGGKVNQHIYYIDVISFP